MADKPETAQEKIDAEAENQSVETVANPTAEEAERTAAQLNNAPVGNEGAQPQPEKETEAAEDPRVAIAARHAARQREHAQEWTGRMTDPNVIAGAGPAQKAAGQDEPATEAVPTEEQPAQAPPATIKVKVDGHEYDVPKTEVDAVGGVAPFQTMAAAQRRLNEANQQLEHARRVRAEAEHFAAMRATPAPTNAEPRGPTASPQPTDTRPATATDPLASYSADDLAEVVNKLQVGSTEEATEALRNFGNRVAASRQSPEDVAQIVRSQLALENERTKSAGAVQDFAKRYNLAENTEAQLLVAAVSQEEMAKDFMAIGIPAQDLAQLSSQELVQRHIQARHHPELQGRFRDPSAILAGVEKNPRFTRYVPMLTGNKPLTVALSEQRGERKNGVQPQPAQRTVPPRAAAVQPQGNRHSAAARQMAEARGQVVVN